MNEGYAVGEVADQVIDLDVADFEFVVEPGEIGWSALWGFMLSLEEILTISQKSSLVL